MRETSEIEIILEKDDTHTRANASIVIPGKTFNSSGRARRNPADANVPMVGEELAAARALSELSHQLVEAAAARISEWEGHSVHLST
jgi:Domain of unknown function (DUF1876)